MSGAFVRLLVQSVDGGATSIRGFAVAGFFLSRALCYAGIPGPLSSLTTMASCSCVGGCLWLQGDAWDARLGELVACDVIHDLSCFVNLSACVMFCIQCCPFGSNS